VTLLESMAAQCRLMMAYNDKYTAIMHRVNAYRLATALFASFAALSALAALVIGARLLWLL
jgi:hypothetical protein